MRRVLVFGNAGSGKSTLGRRLQAEEGLAHLDLDTLAWLPGVPPERRPLDATAADILAFVAGHEAWVIEGCYADLLGIAAPHATEAIYLDLPVSVCLAHAQARPFEPHKYETPEAQDANLAMLLDWIRTYPTRDDVCSATAHHALFDAFDGSRQRPTAPPA